MSISHSLTRSLIKRHKAHLITQRDGLRCTARDHKARRLKRRWPKTPHRIVAKPELFFRDAKESGVETIVAIRVVEHSNRVTAFWQLKPEPDGLTRDFLDHAINDPFGWTTFFALVSLKRLRVIVDGNMQLAGRLDIRDFNNQDVSKARPRRRDNHDDAESTY